MLLRRILIEQQGEKRPFRILDLGGSDYYWSRFGLNFLAERGIEITILNNKASEMGAEDCTVLHRVVGDACATGYPDGAFDFVHSNSVIEHVGSWQAMEDFANEVRRLGAGYYVQVPNWWFPIEPHFVKVPFIHWMPRWVRAEILYRFPVAHAGRLRPKASARKAVRHAKLLTARQLRKLFPGATIEKEKFFGLSKSLIAVG